MHKNDNASLPLNVFLKCSECNQPFTGYVVKAKQIYYYKCRTDGCRCNKNAKELNEKFGSYLMQFQFRDELSPLLQKQLELIYDDVNKSCIQERKLLQQRLKESRDKLETMEDKFYLESKMPTEVFERLKEKCEREITDINREIAKLPENISNHKKTITKALNLSGKISTTWALEKVAEKKKLQKLIFPEGIIYDRRNDGFRTQKITSVFELIAEMTSLSSEKKGTKN